MDEHVLPTYRRAEEIFEDGDGAVLWDRDGREYLDFLGGIAVSALGHAHPALRAALRDQIGKVLHTSNLYRHAYTEPVAAALAELTGLEAVFFCNSGAEAMEAALKVARKHQRLRGAAHRTSFVALEGSFHGRTLGALSVTHALAYREPFGPLAETTFVPPDDEVALRQALAAEPAALVLEPIQGEGGIRELAPDFLHTARQLCDTTATVLIHDEVQCGSGRTGTFLAADAAGTKPDIATLAKPLAAGLPMGATVVRRDLAGVLQPGDHGSTFAGGPLVCRACQVFLDELRGGLQQNVVERGRQLRAGLERIAAGHASVREVRGRGLMLGLRLRDGAAELQAELYRRRLIANCTAGDVIRFLPPYVITEEQVDQGLDILDTALRQLQ